MLCEKTGFHSCFDHTFRRDFHTFAVMSGKTVRALFRFAWIKKWDQNSSGTACNQVFTLLPLLTGNFAQNDRLESQVFLCCCSTMVFPLAMLCWWRCPQIGGVKINRLCRMNLGNVSRSSHNAPQQFTVSVSSEPRLLNLILLNLIVRWPSECSHYINNLWNATFGLWKIRIMNGWMVSFEWKTRKHHENRELVAILWFIFWELPSSNICFFSVGKYFENVVKIILIIIELQ